MSHFCFRSLSRRLKKRSKPHACGESATCLEILVGNQESEKLYQLLLQMDERHQDPTTARGGRSKSRTSPGSD
uniref:Polyhomeotic 1 homolog n=1 Tax=Pan troglodytes TaxID=9598 RepID=G2HEB3_PANTR|nr:polyhomeotic 1 homolog [Pan troglodytes]